MCVLFLTSSVFKVRCLVCVWEWLHGHCFSSHALFYCNRKASLAWNRPTVLFKNDALLVERYECPSFSSGCAWANQIAYNFTALYFLYSSLLSYKRTMIIMMFPSVSTETVIPSAGLQQPALVYAVLWTELKSSAILGKHSANWVTCPSFTHDY